MCYIARRKAGEGLCSLKMVTLHRETHMAGSVRIIAAFGVDQPKVRPSGQGP